MKPRPPERIDLGDVVLRRYTPDDAAALSAVATEERDHLSPWMAWATPDGVTIAAMTTFIAETNGRAAEGTEAVYGIFAPLGRLLGACGLHDRIGPGGVEIGYWLTRDATGHGLMTRVVGTLTDLVLTLDDITFVEIHCDEANVRSAAVARRLGYTLVRTEDRDVAAPAETGHQQTWVRTGPPPPAERQRPRATGHERSIRRPSVTHRPSPPPRVDPPPPRSQIGLSTGQGARAGAARAPVACRRPARRRP